MHTDNTDIYTGTHTHTHTFSTQSGFRMNAADLRGVPTQNAHLKPVSLDSRL